MRKDMRSELEKHPLFLAIEENNLNGVKSCLEYENINDIPKFNGWTPLMVACKFGFLEIVDYLVKKGADVKVKNPHYEEKFTALDFARKFNHKEVIKYLENEV